MKSAYGFFIIILFISGCTNTNLLKNPGAETKPFTPDWTIAEGRWMQRKASPLPQEGKAYFFPGVALHAELYQDVEVSRYSLLTDFGLVDENYSAYVRAFPQKPADVSYEVIEFRDGTENILDSFVSERCDSVAAWIHVADNRTLPKGTRTIRVRLLSDRYNGSNNDGYHDNLSLSLSLSPLVYLVIAILILLLLFFVYRKFRKKKVVVK